MLRREGLHYSVLVIWGPGLISLIALTVITVGRRRNLVVANLIENAKAKSLAEAGVNLRRLELRAAAFSSDPPNPLHPHNGEPLLCTMPQGRWLRWRSKTKAVKAGSGIVDVAMDDARSDFRSLHRRQLRKPNHCKRFVLRSAYHAVR